MEHLFHNAHGEWAILSCIAVGWSFGRGFLLGFWRSFLAGLPEKKYRVQRVRVRCGEATHRTYGPYRTFLWSYLVAHWVCGEWDCVTVEEQR